MIQLSKICKKKQKNLDDRSKSYLIIAITTKNNRFFFALVLTGAVCPLVVFNFGMLVGWLCRRWLTIFFQMFLYIIYLINVFQEFVFFKYCLVKVKKLTNSIK